MLFVALLGWLDRERDAIAFLREENRTRGKPNWPDAGCT
jgi:hypothetical protein